MYDSKNNYRDYFNTMKKYVKITKLAQEIGINNSTICLFMRHEEHNGQLSIDKLEKLRTYCVDSLNNLM